MYLLAAWKWDYSKINNLRSSHEGSSGQAPFAVSLPTDRRELRSKSNDAGTANDIYFSTCKFWDQPSVKMQITKALNASKRKKTQGLQRIKGARPSHKCNLLSLLILCHVWIGMAYVHVFLNTVNKVMGMIKFHEAASVYVKQKG